MGNSRTAGPLHVLTWTKIAKDVTRMTVGFAEECNAHTANLLLTPDGCESRLTQQSHIWPTSASGVLDIALTRTMTVVVMTLVIL